MPVELRNIKGGGIHYVAYLVPNPAISSRPKPSSSAPVLSITAPTRRDWLRILAARPTTTTTTPSITKEYLRFLTQGCIVHSRSSSNQYFNFHYMYGGFKRWVVDRYLVGSLYRNGFRVMWFPALLYYICTCLLTQSAATTWGSTTTPLTTSSTSQIEHDHININSSIQWAHEVIVLEVTLQFYLWVGVNSLSVHLISKPLASVVALVGPCVSTLSLPISILELSLVYVSIREDI